jgi:glycoside hydrolase-like protein
LLTLLFCLGCLKGWGFIIIFLGQQDKEVSEMNKFESILRQHLKNDEEKNQTILKKAIEDANLAVGEAKKQGFEANSFIFLDIETNEDPVKRLRLSKDIIEYAKRWCIEITNNGFNPGVYIPGDEAKDVKSKLEEEDATLKNKIRYWIHGGPTMDNDDFKKGELGANWMKPSENDYNFNADIWQVYALGPISTYELN